MVTGTPVIQDNKVAQENLKKKKKSTNNVTPNLQEHGVFTVMGWEHLVTIGPSEGLLKDLHEKLFIRTAKI